MNADQQPWFRQRHSAADLGYGLRQEIFIQDYHGISMFRLGLRIRIRIGSGFNQVNGSGPGFGIQIRI
jgi:hypothetical protein